MIRYWTKTPNPRSRFLKPEVSDRGRRNKAESVRYENVDGFVNPRSGCNP